ncbi:MAG: CBS domain-containing protein [Bryobacteraceae bacterium]
MKACEVMTREPVTVAPETTVGEIARLLTERRISGVPVVDSENKLVGIITETDLFPKEKGVPFSMVRLPSLFDQWLDPEQIREFYEASKGRQARDVMTKDVASVGPEDDIGTAAKIMMNRHVNRIPVVENGKLIGIITRQDLIRWMAKT